EDYGLNAFVLQRSGNKIRYSYTCTPIKFSKCYSDETSRQEGDNGETFYLDRHNVDAGGDNAVLIGFSLDTDYYGRGWFKSDGRKVKYKYTYCLLRNIPAEQTAAQNAINASKSKGLRVMEDTTDEQPEGEVTRSG